MNKSRDLNIFDIWLHRKDFLWGKDYFGMISGGSLVDSILFGSYRYSDHVIEILKLENKSDELLRKFTEEYSSKNQIKYFVIELDEKESVEDIDLVNRCGFKRYSRNYYYKLTANDFSPSREVKVICREADTDDIGQILDLDCTAQALEYRDYLFSTKKFVKERIADYYVFVDPHNFSQVLAFVFKRDNVNPQKVNYEFVTTALHSDIIPYCIEAFAERHLRFDKNTSLDFIVSSIHKDIIAALEQKYTLKAITQNLIFEGVPREHSMHLNPGFAFRSVTST